MDERALRANGEQEPADVIALQGLLQAQVLGTFQVQELGVGADDEKLPDLLLTAAGRAKRSSPEEAGTNRRSSSAVSLIIWGSR
jgi:hypothetical protein